MTFQDNPHLAFVNIKRFHKAEPFTMPPPEGIIPQMCRALERSIRQPHVWGKKKHYVCSRTGLDKIYADAYKREEA